MADSEQGAVPAAVTPPEAQSVGTLLRQARAARDLSLEQVSTELRIEAKQLDALEQDRFERIGVPVFVKGYLRQYGARLGLDVRELLALYHKQTSLKEIQVQPSKTIKLRDERQITVWIVAAVFIAVLGVALAVWWWNGGALRIGGPPPATQTSTEPAAARVAAAPAASQTSVEVPAPAAVPTEVATAAGLPATARMAAAREFRSAAPAAALAALQVTFDQDSWAEISDARGERLFYGLGSAGRNAKLNGEPPFAVVLGNAAGVKLALDGDDFPVPTNGKPGDYARFSVDVGED